MLKQNDQPAVRYTRWIVILCFLFLTSCWQHRIKKTEILWDTWGVPHIYARNEADLHYAMGWAQMESHGNRLLKLFGISRGKAAEYWGEEWLESDKYLATLRLPAIAREWVRKQDPDYLENLQSFIQGMNDYASQHPQEIEDSVKVVLPLAVEDLMAHFIRTIHFTFVGGGTQWNAYHWEQQQQAGSNGWAIGPSHSQSGAALLLANPHMLWDDVFTWYEMHLVAPGIDITGVSLLGAPAVVIGFNQHLGWTHTVNVFDGVDLYELTLGENGYIYDGKLHAFNVDTTVLKCKNRDGSMREEAFAVYRSVQGPVVAMKDGKALAVRMVGLDRPGLFEQYWQMMQASDLGEFEDAMSELQMPMFNTLYADDRGNILYVDNAMIPKRPYGDFAYWSGIIPGDTSGSLWNEIHPYKDLPRIKDPSTGWLQNANDPPWTTTIPPVLKPENFPAYFSHRGMNLRAQRSAKMLMADEKISLEEMIEYKHNTYSELADRLLDDLAKAVEQHGDAAGREAMNVLKAWDRKTDAESRGAVLFVTWWSMMGRGNHFSVSWDPDKPLSTPDGLNDPVKAASVLSQAAHVVRKRYGRLDVPYGDVFRLRMPGLDLPGNGGSGDLGIFRVLEYQPDQDGRYHTEWGDSYVAAVEFSQPLRAQALLSYGNASQPGSKHRGDQLILLSEKKLRPVWLTREEIEKNLEKKESF